MILDTAVKYSLIYFEYETVCELSILINVYPCAICAWLVSPSIVEYPLIASGIINVLNDLDVALDFRKKLVVYGDVCVAAAANRNFSISILHITKIIFEFITRASAPKILQLQVFTVKVLPISILLRIKNSLTELDINVYVADTD